jgi:hypothetical protein
MFFYQGKGEKNERAVANHIATLHNSFLVNEFLSLYPTVKRWLKDRVSDRVSEFGTQEQEQEQEQEQNTPIVPKGTCGNGSALFDEWWNLYPRKEAKGKALEAWKKAGKRLVCSGMTRPGAVAHLLDRVQAYASSPRATQSDPSKIPHPATWLNQGRYDDDPQTWQTPLVDRGVVADRKDDTYIDLNFDLEGD